MGITLETGRDAQAAAATADIGATTTASSTILVSRAAIASNVARLRRMLDDGEELGAVVKADGYGIGAVPLVRTLQPLGVRWFFAFDAQQAADLRRAMDAGSRVLVLRSRTTDRPLPLHDALAADPRVHWTVHEHDDVSWMAAIGQRAGRSLDVHLEVDTGMNRGGCAPADAAGIAAAVRASPWLRFAGIASHLATAGSDAAFARTQHARLRAVAWMLEDRAPVHLRNSGGVLCRDLAGTDLARIGLGLLGYAEIDAAGADHARPDLTAALRWESSICQVRHVAGGEWIGYGRTFRAPADMRVGVVPVGYGDGYPARAAGNGRFEVGVRRADGGWTSVPIVGLVNMDQITIDLGRLAGGGQVGDRVAVYGTDPAAPNHPQRVAATAGTVVHEILCRLSPRIPRHWT